MATNQTISLVLKKLSIAYPRFLVADDDDKRKEMVLVWADFLADLDDDLLMAAVARFISSSKHAFAPSIPEIRSEATDMLREISEIPSSFEAWDEVIKAPIPSNMRIMRDGEWFEPQDYVWKNEVVGVVAKRLGWPKRFPSGESEMADRAHFVKAYDAEIVRRMKTETQLPQVTKFIEQKKAERILDVTSEMKKLTEAKRS